MRRHPVLLLTLLLLVCAANAYGADSIGAGYRLPADVTAGEKVTITIPGTFTDTGTRSVKISDVSNPDVPVKDLVPSVSAKRDSLSFDLIPGDLKPGRYIVKIQLGEATVTVPGELPVVKRAEAPPAAVPAVAAALPVAIQAVRPVSPYPIAKHKNLYDFEIAGTNFAKDIKDSHVEINKVPIDVVYKVVNKDGKLECHPYYKKPCLSSDR